MKKRLRYFIVIIIMMIGILPSKAVVVFDTNTDIISGKNSITKDGITISTTNGEAWEFNDFYGELSITSSNGNIVMIGLEYELYNNYWEDATNNAQFINEEPSKVRSINSQIIRHEPVTASTGTIEDCDDYCVWKGQSNNITLNIGEFPESESTLYILRRIHVYFEEDELPNKMPYVIYYRWHDYWYNTDFDNRDVTYLSFNYGYKQFIPRFDFHEEDYGPSMQKECYSIKEDGSYQEWKGLNVQNIYFSQSFREYKPTNTSYWFYNIECEESVDFSNLNMSKITDVSYMFKGSNIQFDNLDISQCKNINYMCKGYKGKKLDITSLSFSNHPVSTETFANSNIIYLTVSPSINDARNDIFKGLGTTNNPCYLIAEEGVVLNANSTDGTFQWKSGYFKLPQIEAYVVHRIQHEWVYMASSDIEYYFIDFDFHYDIERELYESSIVHDEYDWRTGIKGVSSLPGDDWVYAFNKYWSYLNDNYYYSDFDNHYELLYVCSEIAWRSHA